MDADVLPDNSPPGKGGPFDVADLLVAYLEQLRVEYVFGVPGGAIKPLYV